MTANQKPRTIFDFAEPATVQDWSAIDDRIMGGQSASRPEYVAGTGLRFRGTVSLANDGGFASLRSADADYDLGGCSGLVLKVRGDGKRYKLSLRTDRYFDGISYQAAFTTSAGAWLEVDLPFANFVPTHHGRTLTTVEPLHPEQVQSFGLFIADRQAGPFQLDVAWIGCKPG